MCSGSNTPCTAASPDAKQFYLSYTAMVALAAAIVLIPNAPLGLITTAVQALAGLLLPSASVFLLLLCNDREVLGPWVNRRWVNAVAGLIVGVLLFVVGDPDGHHPVPRYRCRRRRGLPRLGPGGTSAAAGFVTLRWLARRQPQPSGPEPIPPTSQRSTALLGGCHR